MLLPCFWYSLAWKNLIFTYVVAKRLGNKLSSNKNATVSCSATTYLAVDWDMLIACGSWQNYVTV